MSLFDHDRIDRCIILELCHRGPMFRVRRASHIRADGNIVTKLLSIRLAAATAGPAATGLTGTRTTARVYHYLKME
ncbi:MAG: hypothetical protein JNK25_14975 [Phycisphaerae bacterium]|nr:hypothetical protein [Phycisphaerae bacterium]